MLSDSKNKDFLTVPEAADYLRIGKSTVYEMVADGRIKTVKLPGVRRHLISKKSLERLF